MPEDQFSAALFGRLKIASFSCLLSYPRRDLASRTERVIDEVLQRVQSAVREATYTGTVKTSVDDDGDIQFAFESGRFHFLLDVRSDICGAQFKELVNHDAALGVSKAFFDGVVPALALPSVDVFAVDFRSIFDVVPTTGRANVRLFVDRLMPVLGPDQAYFEG